MYLNTLCPGWDKPPRCGGNLLLSGRESAGGDACFLGIARELMLGGDPILICHDHISDEACIALFRDALAQGYRVHRIGTHGFSCPPFDFLSAADDSEGKAELICQLLSRRGDDAHFFAVACRYLRDVLRFSGDTCCIRDILSVDVETVRARIASCEALDEAARDEELCFLDTREVFSCIHTLRTRASHLAYLLDGLSGDTDVTTLFSGKSLLFVGKEMTTADPTDKFSGLLSGFMQMAVYLFDRFNGSHMGYHLLLNCGDALQTRQLMQLLELGVDARHIGIPICLYRQSVSSLVRSHTEAVFDLFDTAAVFRTGEGQFWSEFFGTMLTADITQSYTRKKSALNVYTGGGVVDRPIGKYEGTTVHRVEKPLYEARAFSALADNTCLCYDLRTGRKGKKVLGGSCK